MNELDDLLGRLEHDLPRPSRWLTVSLGTLSAVHMVVILPWLFGADPLNALATEVEGHVTRDGALSLVTASAGLITAAIPRWAGPGLAIAAVALAAQFVAGLFDSEGHRHLIGEPVHIPSILIAIGIAMVNRRPKPMGPRSLS